MTTETPAETGAAAPSAASSKPAKPAKPASRMTLLKEERGPASDALLTWVREHNVARTAIRRALTEKGAMTVPELAEATGLSTRTVFWTVTTMRKYGLVVEDVTDGSYVRYGVALKDPRA